VFPLSLALGASVAWGASDFLGGLVSRRLAVATVLFWAQLTGLALAAAAWLLAGGALPSGGAAAMGAAAGLAELAGFALLYRGLAVGEMSTVAPLAALTAVLPVAVSLGAGERVAALEAGGMALAIAGSALAAGDAAARRIARGAGLGLAAALAFGVFLLALGDAGEEAGPAAVLCGRIASVTVLAGFLAGRDATKVSDVFVAPGRDATSVSDVFVAPARDATKVSDVFVAPARDTTKVSDVFVAPARAAGLRGLRAPARADQPALALLGGLDVLANLAYAEAARRGADATVSVLGSLYPLTTVLLARAVLGERLGRSRMAGVTAVLGGVALISLSS
jgi:drug/metabolite transporter (DMT)-like permease